MPFPLELGASTPRIVWKDTVMQRARWRYTRSTAGLAAAYPGTSFALFEHMRRCKRQGGLPERVFVKLSSQPKPFFVDFRCFFLLEAWEALFAPDVQSVVSEMLPSMGELWMTDHSGEQVTSELRTSLGRGSQAHRPSGTSRFRRRVAGSTRSRSRFFASRRQSFWARNRS